MSLTKLKQATIQGQRPGLTWIESMQRKKTENKHAMRLVAREYEAFSSVLLQEKPYTKKQILRNPDEKAVLVRW